MQLWKYLKQRMKNNLKQEICENNHSITFEKTIVFTEEFSKKLKGIKCCAILCQSEMTTGLALLSCFAAGVTALPLSKRYGELHCNKILDTISPDAIITDSNGKLQIVHIRNSSYVEPPKHPALIMCTSGTTGIPKGAMLTEQNLLTNIFDICIYFAIDNTDTILISRPLYHCAVLTGEFLTGLVKGVKIHFYSEAFNPPFILSMLKKYGITAFGGTPTLLSAMIHFKRKNDEYNLKHICISGECMSKETGDKISSAFPTAYIYHVYGLTEASPRVSYLPPELFKEYSDFVGYPLRSISLKILSDTGKPVNVNETGILWIKGENIMSGYYKNSEKTDEVLNNGWLRTGDLALINEVGLLKIRGRSDDLIIKAGMNIYPQEIESVIKLDNRVKDVYVHRYSDEKSGEQIAMVISGEFLDISEVRQLCKDSLPAFQIPTKITLVDEIPKNGSGKIVRR